MHALSNFEIDKYLNHLPFYKGCKMSDELRKKKIAPNEVLVINLDKSINQGTHWCLIFNAQNRKAVIYIDPFGLPPNNDTLKYLRTSNKKVIYNTSQIQDMTSVLCGYYCIFFAIELSKGRNLYDVLYTFTFNTQQNELIIRDYFHI